MCTRESLSEKSTIYNSRVSRVLRSLGVEMSSLCPHQFDQYLKKVTEIVETYKPQILACVKYKDISESLLRLKVLRRRDHADISKVIDSAEQMNMVLQIVQKKMWGLENFMTALIDGNKETWLSEELFQAYVRHLVTNMKKLQSQPVCDCFHGGKNSVLYRSWLRALESFDGYLYRIGSSLGFLTQTIRPVNGVLDFIRNKLPIARQKIVTVEQCDVESSDSEEEEKEEFEWDEGGDLHDFVNVDQSLGAIPIEESNPVNTNPKMSISSNPSPPKVAIKGNNIAGQINRTSVRSSSTRSPKISASSTTPMAKTTNHPKPVAVPRKKAAGPSKNKSSRTEDNSKATSKRTNPSELGQSKDVIEDQETTHDGIKSTSYLTNASFYSISLSTGSEGELDVESQLDSVKGIAKNQDQKTSADFDGDDDDAFLPQPVESAITTPVQVEVDLTPAQQILRKHKINQSIKTPENSILSSASAAPTDSAIIPKDEILDQSINEIILSKPKPVQTISSSTQTISSEPDSLPKLVPEPVMKSTACTQTTPPSSPTRTRRSNSFPSLLSKDIGFSSHQSSAYSLNPNVFRDERDSQKHETEIETELNGPLEVGTIAARSGRARIFKPVPGDDPKKSEGQGLTKEKKPFLRKQSGHTSTMRKISSAISSAVSTLKPSSSSEKKITRALSTSSATPTSKPQTKPFTRSASVSTSTSTTKTIATRAPARKLASTSTVPNPKGKPTPPVSNSNSKSANIAKPVLKPTIPLRQRIHAEIRETKANAPPPPPMGHQERLSPNDYNLQQLSNAWAAKQKPVQEQPEQNNNYNTG